MAWLIHLGYNYAKVMKTKSESFKKTMAALIIAFSLSLVLILAHAGGLFNFIELKLYDLRVKLFASSLSVSHDIVLVLLDEDSMSWASRERGWGYPWPRTAYAELTDYLSLGGAKSLVFDVGFYEAARDSYIQDEDGIFARATERFGRTVQLVVFSTQTGTDNSWPNDLQKPFFELQNFGSIYGEYEKLNQNTAITSEVKAQFPVEKLRNAAGIIGSATGWADSDNIFRRVNLFTIFDGKAVPGLSAASLIISGEDRVIRYNEKKHYIEWGDRIIPVDKNGRSILRFRSNFMGGLDAYHPYKIMDVLQSAEDYRNGKEPIIYPEDFADKYVFFGYYAQGLFDTFPSPLSPVYAGVGMHVTMLDNILSQDLVRECPPALAILFIPGVIILIVLLSLYTNRISLNVGGVILILAGFSGAALIAYRFYSLWLPMAAPLISAILAFITTSVYNYATEGSKKRFIKAAFSQYLSPQVIDQLIEDPSKLNLGGETRDMTAIFTDIQKFSSISEALQKEYAEEGPKALVSLLNIYLTEMSNIILANGGTIDKYEGDAIIAFFGAPVWTDKHAALACRSAILMKRQEVNFLKDIMNPEGSFYKPLSRLIESRVIRSERPLYTRLGINSGNMVVGNMGTPSKMDYTIMGNAVNLAARLEGVNKQYDTGGILISEYTRDKIGDEFLLRGLSRVRVVGINTPLRLYELLELKEEASREMLDMAETWERGFRAYENTDFLEAKNTFSVIYQKNEKDKVAKLYLDRCEKYLASPLSEHDWDDGIDNLTEK